MPEQKKKKVPKYNYDQTEPCFRLFKGSITSPDTAYVWTNYLHNYMYFHKMKKYSDVLKGNHKLIQAMLVEYVQSKKEKVRAQSIGSQLTALRHFFWINHRNKDTEWDWVRHFIGEASKAVEDKPYTHVQIKAMLNVAKPRIKIAIYSEAQGGPRVGAIPIIKRATYLEPHTAFIV